MCIRDRYTFTASTIPTIAAETANRSGNATAAAPPAAPIAAPNEPLPSATSDKTAPKSLNCLVMIGMSLDTFTRLVSPQLRPPSNVTLVINWPISVLANFKKASPTLITVVITSLSRMLLAKSWNVALRLLV